MTIIAAAVDATGAYIGCDSAGTTDQGVVTEYATKLVSAPDRVVVGFSYSYAVEPWLRREFVDLVRLQREDTGPTPLWSDRVSWIDFLEDSWLRWRGWASRYGHGKADDDGAHIIPGLALFAWPEGLAVAQEDGAVLVPADNYYATGAGRELALGSFHTTRTWKSARRRVDAALRAACHHSASCGGRIYLRRSLLQPEEAP